MKIYKLSAAIAIALAGLGCTAIEHSSAQQKNAATQKTSPSAAPSRSAVPPSVPPRASDADVRLKRFAPKLEAFQSNDAQIFHAPDVPPKIVKLAAALAPERLNSESNPQLYKVPATDDVYLAAISDSSHARYVLFKDKGAELIESEHSRALEYDDIMDTTFFSGGGRILVVAGVGTAPDFDGLEVFEY